MGIDCRIEDAEGQELKFLEDNTNLVSKILPHFNDNTYSCLRFIDPYGDTTFNNQQLPTLIAEITRRLIEIKDQAVKAHAEKIINLAQEAKNGVHIYLKFYGD